MLIEQAIFTSAQSDHAAGYHLVARSPGVDERDARELTIWGPSHDSLESCAEGAASVNFFRLPSGAYCVSKTQIAGEEYSGRGLRTYTNCLIVTAQVMARFANSPFAILRAASAKGLLRVCDSIPAQLVPFQLAGRAAPVDEGLVGQLIEQYGADSIGSAIESLFDQKPVILLGAGKPESTVAGLLSLLPASCRREVPFTTGLKYSPRRPFSLLVASEESAEVRRLYRQQLVSVIDLAAASKSSPAAVTSGWAAYIAEAIAQDAVSAVIEKLRERQEGLRLADLNELGEHWRREIPSGTPAPHSRSMTHKPDEPPSTGNIADARDSDDGTGTTDDDLLPEFLAGHVSADDRRPDESRREPNDDRRRALDRRERAARQMHLDQLAHLQTPPMLMEADSQEVVDHLERLDDVVFEAMSGDERALEEMGRLWPQLLARLGPDKLDESREQYLRHSLSVWETCLENGLHEPERALASLQVLSILFGEK